MRSFKNRPLIGIIDAERLRTLIGIERLAAIMAVRSNDCDLVAASGLWSLRSDELSGVFCATGMPVDIPFLETLKRSKRAAAAIFLKPRGVTHCCVDLLPGMVEAISHLVELGHTRIAYLSAPGGAMFSEREIAFRQAIEIVGLGCDPDLIATCDSDFNSSYQAMQRLLGSGARFSAVIACSDRAAWGCIYAARQRGLIIPHDLAIIGTGNSHFVRSSIDYDITSINMPTYTVAHRGMLRLIEEVRNPSLPPVSISVPARLVKRSSTIGKAFSPASKESRFGPNPGLLSFLFLIGDSMAIEAADALAAEIIVDADSKKPAIESVKDGFLKAIEFGSDPYLLHNLYLGLEQATAAGAGLDEVIETLFEQTRGRMHTYSRYAAEVRDRFDLLLQPLRDLKENRETIETYVHALQSLCSETRSKNFALISLDNPCSDPLTYQGTARLWTFDKTDINSHGTITLDHGLSLRAVLSHFRTHASIEAIPLESADGLLGLLIWDMEAEHSLFNYKLKGVLTAKFQRTRLFESLKEKQRDLAAQTIELEEKRKAAESASRAKSQFLAVMSHEIRTPLNCIIGMTDLLRITAIEEERKSYIEMMSASEADLLTLINDILDYASIQSGNEFLSQQPFSLYEIFEHSCGLHKERAAAKNLKFTSSIDGNVPRYAFGDPRRIRQIFNNLLANAVKFTAKGTVSARLSCQLENQRATVIEFTIEDSGIGIAPEARPKIFEPFHQADSSDSRAYEGTGLGLAIVSQLLKLMGGSISLESEIGLGTRIDVAIPLLTGDIDTVLAMDPESSQAPNLEELFGSELAASPAGLGQQPILLVEDNPESAITMIQQLKGLNLTLDLARDGQDALAQWELRRHSLMLIDIQLKGLTGIETARIIRQREAERSQDNRRTTIVALYNPDHFNLRQQCVQAGMDGCLAKSFTRQTLRDLIESALHGELAFTWD